MVRIKLMGYFIRQALEKTLQLRKRIFEQRNNAAKAFYHFWCPWPDVRIGYRLLYGCRFKEVYFFCIK